MLKVTNMASILRLPYTQNLPRKFSAICAFGLKKPHAAAAFWSPNVSKDDPQPSLNSTFALARNQDLLDKSLHRLRWVSASATLPCSRLNISQQNGVSFQCMFTRTFFSSSYICRRASLSLFKSSLLQSQSSLPYLFLPCGRFYSSDSQHKGKQKGFSLGEKNKSVMMYVMAIFIFAVGVTYAAVPLYSVFCQATGYGGAVKEGHDTSDIETMKPIRKRPLLINFNADTAASMRWNFKPQQREVVVYPGETALAFYSAVNPTDKPIVGISTYNVVPFEAGKYFNKIQCFCFEEQRLNPYEQVDMPVFFFIDPEFAADPKMDKVDNIILSYTFFEAKEGLQLPDPMERR